jgi:hypothetical protein
LFFEIKRQVLSQNFFVPNFFTDVLILKLFRFSKNQTGMRTLLLFTLMILCIADPLAAQETPDDVPASERPFLRNGFRVSVRPSLARKANVTPDETYQPGASHFISLGAGLDYACHFSPEWSLITGLHGLWHGSNFTFFVPGSSFQPPLDFDLAHEGPTSGGLEHGIISARATLEKRWFSKKGTIWNTGLGVGYNYSPTTGYQMTYAAYQNGQTTEYAYLMHNPYNDAKPFVTAHLMLGRYWQPGRKTLLLANFVANYSFSNFIRGQYVFQIPGKPVVTGNYNIDGSYIGLDICYMLPKKKKYQ